MTLWARLRELSRPSRPRSARAAPQSRWAAALFRPKAARAPSRPPAGTAPAAPPAAGRALSAAYLALFTLIVIATAAALVYHLHVRFAGIELGYTTSAARARQSRLVLERQELRLELASLKSPARVEAEARERLGMAVPGHDRIILIGEARRPASVSGGAQ